VDHDVGAEGASVDAEPHSSAPTKPDGWPDLWGDDCSILHIYPQASYHGVARIVATPVALRELAEALLKAAADGRAEYVTMCHDGEGYAVKIERTNSTGLGYTRAPYHPDWGCAGTDTEHLAYLRELLAEAERRGFVGDGDALASSTMDDGPTRNMNKNPVEEG
jgi:hypothetical protein